MKKEFLYKNISSHVYFLPSITAAVGAVKPGIFIDAWVEYYYILQCVYAITSYALIGGMVESIPAKMQNMGILIISIIHFTFFTGAF